MTVGYAISQGWNQSISIFFTAKNLSSEHVIKIVVEEFGELIENSATKRRFSGLKLDWFFNSKKNPWSENFTKIVIVVCELWEIMANNGILQNLNQPISSFWLRKFIIWKFDQNHYCRLPFLRTDIHRRIHKIYNYRSFEIFHVW